MMLDFLMVVMLFHSVCLFGAEKITKPLLGVAALLGCGRAGHSFIAALWQPNHELPLFFEVKLFPRLLFLVILSVEIFNQMRELLIILLDFLGLFLQFANLLINLVLLQ